MTIATTVPPNGLLNGRSFADRLSEVLAEVGDMLLAKNRAYGNSALDPVRVFATSDTVEQLRVRLDDKISRMVRGNTYADENTVDDLLGYLLILKMAERLEVERRNA